MKKNPFAELTGSARFLDFIYNLPVGIYVWRLDDPKDLDSFRLVATNPAATRMTGVSVENKIGRKIRQLFPKLLDTPIPNFFAGVIKGDRPSEFGDLKYGDAHVMTSWFNVKAFPLGDRQVGVAFTNINDVRNADATRKNALEAAFSESERRFREIMENIELAAVCLDVKGTITFCNDYILKLSGWNKTEVLGKSWFDIFVPGNDQALKFFEKNIAKGRIPIHYHNSIVTRDEQWRMISWTNVLLRTSGGEVAGTASIGVDVTEREKYEHQLQEKNVALKEVVSLIEIERKEQSDRLAANIRELLMPLLDRLKTRTAPGIRNQIKVIEKTLDGLSGPGPATPGIHQRHRLSPRESEISNMIRSGLTSKDIAKILNITPDTVDTHRIRIRKKLGMTGRKVNMSTYLQSLY